MPLRIFSDSGGRELTHLDEERPRKDSPDDDDDLDDPDRGAGGGRLLVPGSRTVFAGGPQIEFEAVPVVGSAQSIEDVPVPCGSSSVSVSLT